jgi:GNAT superfamily N-acetyltransferase
VTFTTRVGDGDPALDQRLSDELDAFNAAAMASAGEQRELTVRIDDDHGLAAGISGWTWGLAAGIAMTWTRADVRGAGLGADLLESFEAEAARRSVRHVYVTSFTFQAPAFYERHGYVELRAGSRCPSPARPMCTCARSWPSPIARLPA